jgi:hypothetical protein
VHGTQGQKASNSRADARALGLDYHRWPSDSRRSHGFQGLGGLTYQKAATDRGQRGEAAEVGDPSEATFD